MAHVCIFENMFIYVFIYEDSFITINGPSNLLIESSLFNDSIKNVGTAGWRSLIIDDNTTSDTVCHLKRAIFYFFFFF
jgi:hypothetical protein